MIQQQPFDANQVPKFCESYLEFMFIEHIDPFFLYKLLKPSQEMRTLLPYLWMTFFSIKVRKGPREDTLDKPKTNYGNT